MITQKLLKKLLKYDAETGVFRWKIGRRGCRKGSVAGCKNSYGYIHIMIDWKNYKAHRLAWLYVNGYFPEHDIDHINGIRDDNRLCNIREVTMQCNMQNCKKRITNSTGIRGVCWHKRARKYMAQITIHGKRKHLGYYRNLGNAALARFTVEQHCEHWHCDARNSTRKAIDRLFPGMLDNYRGKN